MLSPRSTPSLLLLFSLLAPLALIAAPASAGVHYKADSTTTVDERRPQVTRVEAWVEGPRAKVVFTESDQPMIGKDEYLLTRDGGKTVYLVDPKEKTYAEWDVAAMLATVGSMMESMGGMVDMEISDPSVEKLAEEPVGEMLGRPVTRVRYRTRYTMNIAVFGMKRGQRVETTQDLWVTDAFGDEGLGIWLRKEPPATGFDDLDRLIATEMDKVDGFPLKSLAVSTMSGQKGKPSSTSRVETVVTELEGVAVPDATFELPAGYEKTEMAPPR